MMHGTQNLMQILVVFLLTGCAATAPRMAGPQFTDERVASATTADRAVATELVITPTHVAAATLTPTAAPTPAGLPTATVQPTATPRATATARPTQPVPTYTRAPTVISMPSATATPEAPAVVVASAANVRAGPGTAYPIIGGARVGQRLPVMGQHGDWWQIEHSGQTGWIWGALVTPNAAAQQAPPVTKLPALPTAEAKVEVKAEPTAASTLTSTLTSTSPLPDLVVLGPETQYPVRARVVRGWDYEFVDLSTQYDIVVYRDVFGMLAHQIDDERMVRYRKLSFFKFTPDGVFRIYLVDWAPHPNAECAARGHGTTAQVDFGGDPLGLNTDFCIDNHSLLPLGDGAGALVGQRCNGQCVFAVAAAGANLPSLVVTAFAEALPRSALLGPAGRADFSSAVYRPLGQGRWDATLWRWTDPFVAVVPAGR